MPWETIECSDGAFDINREGIMRIMRSHAWSRAVCNNSKIEVERNSWGPNLESVETNWSSVRAETDATANAFYDEFFRRMDYGLDGTACILFLKDIIDQKDSLDASFQTLKRKAQRNVSEAIEQSVKSGETTLPILEFIRDTSGEFLMVGATALTGGTALALVGAGAAIKAGAKYEDARSPDMGEAVFTFTTELTFGLLGVGAEGMEISKASKFVLGVAFAGLQGGLDTAMQSHSSEEAAKAFGESSSNLVDPISGLFLEEFSKKHPMWSVGGKAILKCGIKMAGGRLMTPAEAMRDKPRLIAIGMMDSAKPTPDFVRATAFQRWPGRSGPF